MVTFKNSFLVFIGWACLLFGVAGLVLPVVPGILLIVIGIYLLSRRQAWAARFLLRLKTSYPEAYAKFEAFKVQVKKLVKGAE
jgi:uncharacterized membrane protein YbaN (DUF454 family)